MSLKQRIEADLKASLLAGDRLTAETLRGLKSVILNEEIAKGARDGGLTDAAIEQLIAKQIKQRDESAALYEQGGNQASADKERAEKKILQGYLPEQLSDQELKSIVEKTIAETGADGPSAMGAVIGKVRAQVGSRADGSTIAELVKNMLL